MQEVCLDHFKSIQAVDHSANTSNRFAFIPTTRVVDILKNQGWFPVKAQEKRARLEATSGFQAHLIRFRRDIDQNRVAVVNEYIAEIVLKNAHDGTAAFSLMAGLFRFVCSNGMVCSDSTFSTHRIKHIGFQDQNVIDAAFDVVKTTPLILDKVNDFKQITLSRPEQLVFAEAALIAKYGVHDEQGVEGLKTRFNLENLITPLRRTEVLEPERFDRYRPQQAENSLWNTFNITQEKLVEKGGRFAKKAITETYSKTVKARGISSVCENVRVNQALWALTEKMAELKA